MSSLVSCLLTLRLHLNDSDFDSRPLFLVSLFLSLYTGIHMHIYILLLLLYTIFPVLAKLERLEFRFKRILVPVTQS